MYVYIYIYIYIYVYVHHSMHWGIKTPLKNTTPLFPAKSPLKLANCPIPFLGNPPLYIAFCEPCPLKLDLSLNPQNIKVFHP